MISMIKSLKKVTLALCVASISQFAIADTNASNDSIIIEPNGNVKTWEWGDMFGYHGYSYIRESFLAKDYKEITIPRVFSQDPEFVGNYKKKNVTATSIALKVFKEPGYPYPLMVTLNIVGEYDNEQYSLYKVGAPMPRAGDEWKEFSFQIPSQSKTFPKGWHVFDMNELRNNDESIDSDTLDKIFRAVMKDVKEISYSMGKRDDYYSVYNQWDVGAKNMKLIQKRSNIIGD